MTVTSNSYGIVSFGDIPAGDYILEETAAPAGYDLNTAKYTVHVSYGEIQIMDSSENIVEVLQFKTALPSSM